VNEKE
jgi:hypothetical protein